MVEYKVLVLLEGKLMFLELFIVGKFKSSKFRLNEKRDFVGWKCYVDFDWKANAAGLVDLLVQ